MIKITWKIPRFRRYSVESCWLRSQAWAIHGFAIAYEYTKGEEFFGTAKKLVDYYVANCPLDYVPYEIPNTVRDNSAAAITASGLLEFRGEKKFDEVASNILNFQCKDYLAEERVERVLKHGCFNKREGKAGDESLIWGGYYFAEAIMKFEN